jgi:hypothetical protein
MDEKIDMRTIIAIGKKWLSEIAKTRKLTDNPDLSLDINKFLYYSVIDHDEEYAFKLLLSIDEGL